MSLLKKIILLIIFLILFSILFKLIKKRTELLHIKRKDNPMVEGLSCVSSITNNEVKKIMDSNLVGEITDSVSSKGYYKGNYTIDKFHIKASYNSGFNGKDISKDMVLYTLYRGYRYLDFEVYYDTVSGENSEAKKAVVSYSDNFTTANVNVPLKDILDVISTNAFSNVSNKNDPLFIQIRPIYTLATSTDSEETKNKKIGENTQLNTQIESALDSITESYKYKGRFTSTTPIKNILKKTIIVMDKVSNKYSNLKSDRLISMINIDPTEMTMCNAESKLDNCNKNNNTLIQVTPNDSTNQTLNQNPHALNIISKTGCNICPMMVWMSSYIGGYSSAGLSQLGEYETLFLKTGGSAFVLLSEVRTYSTLNDQSKVNSATLSYP